MTIQRNVFVKNHYSAIRFAGGLESDVLVEHNTFVTNGVGSSLPSRSEINVDDAGGAAGTQIVGNLFEVGTALINDCYDGASKGFAFGDNFVHGAIPAGAKGSCVGAQTLGDPMLSADLHPAAAAAAPYGAFSP